MKLKWYTLIFVGVLCIAKINAQRLTIDNNQPLPELIEGSFVEGCVEILNVSSPINGMATGIESYGYFSNNAPSFPFSEGIVITTGAINQISGSVNGELLSAGDENWSGDPDLEVITGVTETFNATTIEFEFIAGTNTISFNYLLASEEYSNHFPCEYSDSFAFLIQPADGSKPYQNIALIPNTTIPIATNTIHQEIVGFCDAENEEFFDGYNIGNTNFNGRTVPLTATANIEPNKPYRIKLIVADQRDTLSDSAIFIEAHSFTTEIDLGPDISTCASAIKLDASIQNPQATYEWFLNNVKLPQTTSSIIANEPGGNFKVIASIPLGSNMCTIEDEINISLSTEQASTTLSDFIKCDAENDASETFNLSEKDEEVLNSLGNTGNYTITYHLTEADANSSRNPQTTVINSSNPQTIHVRIEENESGCLAFNHFNLIVNPLPIVNNDITLEKCDTNVVGSESFDLSEITPLLIDDENKYVVTYHETQTAADSGINSVSENYISYQETKTLFVRIRDPITRCFATTTVTLKIKKGVLLSTTVNSIDACDNDLDGFANFDLISAAQPIIENLTNVSISYHLTNQDALDGVNPIDNPSNFTNTTSFEQIIYIRIINTNSGCITLGYIRLFTNRLLSDTNLNPFYVCDDELNDGVEIFDLLEIETTIASIVPNVNVTFYLTETDRDNQLNPIDKNLPFTNTQNPQSLYITISDSNCSEDDAIEIGVTPPIQINPIGNQQICDDSQDGFTTINLTQYSNHYKQGNPRLSVFYFLSEEDAESNTNLIPNSLLFENTSNPQKIVVRVTNTVTQCFGLDNFEIEVLPIPIANQPTDIFVCDNDDDGIATIDLSEKRTEIVGSSSTSTVRFFPSEEDANNSSNEIINLNNFSSNSTKIFALIENPVNTCNSIVSFDIIISSKPQKKPISDYEYCDTNNDDVGVFIFNSKDDEILNGQTQKQITYYTSLQNAENRTSAANKNLTFTNTENPQTIYARIENTADQNCYETVSFDLVVVDGPEYNLPTDLYTCDDISNNGQEIFDLQPVENEIRNGFPDIAGVSFYYSEINAINNTNSLPYSYENIENPQTIFTKIESNNGCFQVVEFELNVVIVGLVNDPAPIIACDDDYDEITTFDLTDENIDILGIRQDDVVLDFFYTEVNAEANTNPISNPETFVNTTNPQLVYVRATNTVSNCYLIVPLDLHVEGPPLLKTFNTLSLCADDMNTVLLSDLDIQIAQNPSKVSISYFPNLTEAENNTNELNTIYEPINSINTLYARVTNTTSGCFIITDIYIEVSDLPKYNIPPTLRKCSESLTANFDLSIQSDFIQVSSIPEAQQIGYFTNHEDAVSNTNSLASEEILNFEAINGDVIFVRLESQKTGCFITTSFEININPFPTIPIQDVTVKCAANSQTTISAATGTTGETYLWSTGATTPEIVLNNDGDYWVTVTSSLGCSNTKNFKISTSRTASVLTIEEIIFTDENSIVVNASGSDNYIFSLDDSAPQNSNVFKDIPIGYHTVTVADLYDCVGIAQQQILVLGFPKFFTPNGDGTHETWHLTDADIRSNATVSIYDRYGKLLKVLNANDPGWDGKFNGRDMPETDYWFRAAIANNEDLIIAKGHFSLVRN